MASKLLNYTVLPSSHAKPVRMLILHGLLGSHKNWSTIARTLAKQSDKAVPIQPILADLRGHGESHGFQDSKPSTVETLAQDVIQLAQQEEIDVIVGHSLGGKVALEMAKQLHAPGSDTPSTRVPLRAVGALDTALGWWDQAQHDTDVDGVRSVLNFVCAHTPPTGRQAMVDAAKQAGFSDAMASWLTSNLTQVPRADASDAEKAAYEAATPTERRSAPWRWTFDTAMIEPLYQSVLSLESWDVLESPPEHVRVWFTSAAQSSRWKLPAMVSRLNAALKLADAAPRTLASLPQLPADRTLVHAEQHGAVVHTRIQAGHWVHVEAPSGVLAVLHAMAQDAHARRGAGRS